MKLDYVLKMKTSLWVVRINTIGKVHVITQRGKSKEKQIFFSSCDLCISNPTLTLEMTIFMIHNC